MTDVVCFDLDSTLANTQHRQWMVPEIKAYKPGGPTWDDYSMACSADTPIEGTVTLLNMLSARGIQPFVITGRNDVAYTLTWRWLAQHRIWVNTLIMRPAGSREKNSTFKIRKIGDLRAAGYNPVLFVEDHPLVAEEIKSQTGIPVLLVNPGYHKGALSQTVAGI